MEDKNQGKPPLPPLLQCAAEKVETKKKLDQASGQTQVNIGTAFQRWSQLQESAGLRDDAMTAEFLLTGNLLFYHGSCVMFMKYVFCVATAITYQVMQAYDSES